MMKTGDIREIDSSSANPSRMKEVLGVLLLSGGWLSMLLAVVFYLFFWRVDNEPGAKDVPWLLWTAVSLCSLGGLAF